MVFLAASSEILRNRNQPIPFFNDRKSGIPPSSFFSRCRVFAAHADEKPVKMDQPAGGKKMKT
jgi:hypothetical protein